MLEFAIKNAGIIMTILFLISELLGENKKIKSNSVFGLIRSFLKSESKTALPEVENSIQNDKT
jgi:hypothetical protein